MQLAGMTKSPPHACDARQLTRCPVARAIRQAAKPEAAWRLLQAARCQPSARRGPGNRFQKGFDELADAGNYGTLTFATNLTAAAVNRTGTARPIQGIGMPALASQADIAELKNLIKRQTLQLTVRLGSLMAIAIAVAVLAKLT